MRNIHILETNNPSRLVRFFTNKFHLCEEILPIQDEEQYQNIYITSDENIKSGDWVYDYITETVYKLFDKPTTNEYKIILTTNQDLINDGVQSIDDDFLKWFIQNPNCEKVEVKSQHIDDSFHTTTDSYLYKIIIPNVKN